MLKVAVFLKKYFVNIRKYFVNRYIIFEHNSIGVSKKIIAYNKAKENKNITQLPCFTCH